ncbi:hypothetical protein Tco_0797466 [Tanacetum coccineum]
MESILMPSADTIWTHGTRLEVPSNKELGDRKNISGIIRTIERFSLLGTSKMGPITEARKPWHPWRNQDMEAKHTENEHEEPTMEPRIEHGDKEYESDKQETSSHDRDKQTKMTIKLQ